MYDDLMINGRWFFKFLLLLCCYASKLQHYVKFNEIFMYVLELNPANVLLFAILAVHLSSVPRQLLTELRTIFDFIHADYSYPCSVAGKTGLVVSIIYAAVCVKYNTFSLITSEDFQSECFFENILLQSVQYTWAPFSNMMD